MTVRNSPGEFSLNRLTAPKRDEFADELASMANGRGGTVLLGVEGESREILGIPVDRLDAVGAWVREICNDSVDPPLDAEIRKIELSSADGSLVAVICVETVRSLFVHKSPSGYFRRIGSSKREMSPELLARLFQERSQSRVIRFDESPVPGTSPENLDDGLTRRFLREDGVLTEDDLRKLRIVANDEDDIARITVAGMLLCTRDPGQWMPHAQIQAVSYVGERQDINYQSDARDFGGPLDDQVIEALHFVRRNMRAVFEALVNAVAHRDYSMVGARIRLHMFGNRLEFYVPGALANTLTPDSMDLRQYSRNELIVSLLARCPVWESEELGRTRIYGSKRGWSADHSKREPCILGPSPRVQPDWRQRVAVGDLGGVIAQSIAKKLSVERAHGRGNVSGLDAEHHADLARPLIDHL